MHRRHAQDVQVTMTASEEEQVAAVVRGGRHQCRLANARISGVMPERFGVTFLSFQERSGEVIE